MKYFTFFLITTAIFILPHCHKKEEVPPTIIYGNITDIKSGIPIYKAYVYCYGSTGPVNQQAFKDFSAYSDMEGNYSISIPSDFTFTFESVQKQGYLNNLFPIEGQNVTLSDSNLVNVQLVPTDGLLRLQISNTSGQHDSLYVKIASPTAILEGLGPQKLSEFPLMLQSGETYIEAISLPSNENIDVYWDIISFSSLNSTFNASVFISFNDTTSYLIEY